MEKDRGGQREDKGRDGGERASRRAGGSERVKRVRRRNGWKAKRGDQEGGYQERTSQVAVRWRIIIVASSVSRISSQGFVIKHTIYRVCGSYSRQKITDPSIENSYLRTDRLLDAICRQTVRFARFSAECRSAETADCSIPRRESRRSYN